MTLKKSILILIVLVYAVGAVTALRYYKFMKEDPAYCSMCHVMEEGYNTWERSKHYLIICQECHSISFIEGNKLLMGRYVKGGSDIQQTHGRREPWDKCMECHLRTTAQGSLTLRDSYGHARHVFMKELACDACHEGTGHQFTVQHAKCQGCHPDKLVHGMGTKGTYCLNCHTFKEGSAELVAAERCFTCHKDVPTSGVMSQVKCYECHHPHEKLSFESKDCLGSCHGNETRVGQHDLHINRLSLGCMDCHKPHIWTVGEKQARGLCDRCHPYKDPRTFIY